MIYKIIIIDAAIIGVAEQLQNWTTTMKSSEELKKEDRRRNIF